MAVIEVHYAHSEAPEYPPLDTLVRLTKGAVYHMPDPLNYYKRYDSYTLCGRRLSTWVTFRSDYYQEGIRVCKNCLRCKDARSHVYARP